MTYHGAYMLFVRTESALTNHLLLHLSNITKTFRQQVERYCIECVKRKERCPDRDPEGKELLALDHLKKACFYTCSSCPQKNVDVRL